MDESDIKSNNKHTLSIIIFIILIFILFKIDIKSYASSTNFQKNITYAEQTIDDLWNKYLAPPINFISKDLLSGNLIKTDASTFDKVFKIKDIQKKMGLTEDANIPN